MSNKPADNLDGEMNFDSLDELNFEAAAERNDAKIDELDAEAAAIPVDNGCGAGGCII